VTDDAVGAALEADEGIRSIGGYVERDGYVYDGERDTYVIACAAARGGQLVRTGAWVRAVWRSYTAGGLTIAEVCREYEIDRQTFEGLKRSLGLTKTRAPWTDEEIAGSTVDALHTDAIRSKEREALTRAERDEWRRIKRDAQRWRVYHAAIRDAVAELELDAVTSTRARVPVEARGGGAVVVGLSDLHVGKRTAGADHTLAESVDGLRSHVARAIEHAAGRYGVPDAFVVPIGSDLLHADTEALTTTSGTPQGAQSVGSMAAAIRAAVSLMAGAVDELATVAPVRAVYVRGNHDAITGYGVACALAERYRSTDRVDVVLDDHPRQWVRVGESGAIVLMHGDGGAHKRLAGVIAAERPAWADYRRAVVVHGHLHRHSLDVAGLVTVGLAAPVTADDWHRHNGWIGARRAITLLRHDGDGLTDLAFVR